MPRCLSVANRQSMWHLCICTCSRCGTCVYRQSMWHLCIHVVDVAPVYTGSRCGTCIHVVVVCILIHVSACLHTLDAFRVCIDFVSLWCFQSINRNVLVCSMSKIFYPVFYCTHFRETRNRYSRNPIKCTQTKFLKMLSIVNWPDKKFEGQNLLKLQEFLPHESKFVRASWCFSVSESNKKLPLVYM